jgi:acyl carrier protein
MELGKTTETREQVRQFIIENFLFGDAEPLADDTLSLLDNGIIDSVGVMELVAHLEKEYGLKVADQELVPENFDSVERLVRFIQTKQDGSR